MKKVLQNLKLIDSLTVSLPVSGTTFIKQLSAAVETVDITPFSGDVANTFDKKEWVGKVDISGFKIRRKSRMFEQRNKAVVTGSFTDAYGKLTIEAEINGFSPILFIAPIISIFIIIFISSLFPQTGGDQNAFSLPGLFFFGLVIVGSPYLAMRRSVTRMKYEFERELVYLANEISV
jgi:hypothetical protein